ncbi:MAG: glycosyltransferase [Micrococcaceae bacterium]
MTTEKKTEDKQNNTEVDNTHLTKVTSKEDTQWRIIQKVIIPESKNTDSFALYIDSGAGISAENAIDSQDFSDAGKSDSYAESIIDRRSFIVPLGERISFATYFNAFPASYWRRWTTVSNIQLVVTTEGSGTLIVNRSNAKGAQQRVDSVKVSGTTTSTFDLSLKPFGDGGWYWFDMVAKSKGFKLVEAYWQAPDNHKTGSYSIGITTFNRPDYCAETAKAIADNSEVREQLRELIIVDQGNEKVQDEEGFDEIAQELGSQLKIVNQANVGGSGGFSRCMYEASENSDADYVVLLDDDIVLEPESFLRLCAFADYARTPTLVGGHMFDMYNRSSLHTFGEVVNQYRFQPGLPNDQMWMNHDFNGGSLRKTSWLHRRIDVDYNGWWMCLIPTSIIKEIGLSLPIFIKWDDVEYGLRAKEAGYPTVSLPGAAVWHVSWGDKDDLVGWQAYFHIRNRMIASLIHSGFDMGGRLIRESQYEDIKHLASMQYYTQAGRIMAMQDLLDGPDVLHDRLDTRLPEIRGMAKDYSDSVFESDPDAFPAAKEKKPRKKAQSTKPVWGVKAVPAMAKALMRQTGSAFKKGSTDSPEAMIAHQDAKWYRLSNYDSVVVSNAEGTAASWYRRDPELLRKQLSKSGALHAKLVKDWPKLRKQFKTALPDITSAEQWKKTFDRITDDPEDTSESNDLKFADTKKVNHNNES